MTAATRTASLLCGSLLAVGPAGCDGYRYAAVGTAPTRPGGAVVLPEPAPTAIPHPGAPKPDAGRLRYDAATHTLDVGDPPVPGGRWMLTTPDEPRGVPVERAYQFPPTVDPDEVSVYYTAANGGASRPVSLREIVAAGDGR